jgi:hypothetical protein
MFPVKICTEYSTTVQWTVRQREEKDNSTLGLGKQCDTGHKELALSFHLPSYAQLAALCVESPEGVYPTDLVALRGLC